MPDRTERGADAVGAGRAGASSMGPADGNRLTGWVASLDPGRWVYVAASVDGVPRAVTVADKFDRDAFARGQGFGWIGFRLDLDANGGEPGQSVEILCLRSGVRLHTHVMRPGRWGKAPTRRRWSVHDFLAEGSAAQAGLDFGQLDVYLSACRDAVGDDEFVRRAYRYVLRREADPGGIAGYGERLRDGLGAVDLLRDLRGSEEFRALKPRPFTVPGMPDFPFYPQN